MAAFFQPAGMLIAARALDRRLAGGGQYVGVHWQW